MTGDEVGATHSPIVSLDLSEAYQLCHDIRNRFPVEPKSAQPDAAQTVSTPSAQIKSTGTVITSKLSLLMNGKVVSDRPFVVQDGQGNSLEYPSQSEADLSLCTGLAIKYGSDPEKINSEFSRSPLYREKWDREDYSQKTIARAIETAEKIKLEMGAKGAASLPVTSAVVEDPFETLQLIPTEDFMELLRKSKLAQPALSWLSQHAELPHQMTVSVDEWIVDRMFRHRGVSEICAEQGSFKSILALFLSRALMEASKNSDGEGTFLGRRVRTNFGNGDSRPLVIYYIDNDSPKSLTKKNCLRIGINQETNTGTFKVYGAYMEFPVTKIDDPRLVEAARRERAYFIFDTLSKVFEGMKENDPVDANYIMTKATRLAYASEGVLILHHDSKDGGHGYRGATPIVSVPDMSFTLSRKKGENVAILKEIRFKDVEYYEIKIQFFFEAVDSKGGDIVIRDGYSCRVLLDSLLERDKSSARSANGVLNLRRSKDDEWIDKARMIIEKEAAAGKPAPSQAALARLLGLKDNRAKDRILCVSTVEEPRPWDVETNNHGWLKFHPLVKQNIAANSLTAAQSNNNEEELMPGFEFKDVA